MTNVPLCYRTVVDHVSHDKLSFSFLDNTPAGEVSVTEPLSLQDFRNDLEAAISSGAGNFSLLDPTGGWKVNGIGKGRTRYGSMVTGEAYGSVMVHGGSYSTSGSGIGVFSTNFTGIEEIEYVTVIRTNSGSVNETYPYGAANGFPPNVEDDTDATKITYGKLSSSSAPVAATVKKALAFSAYDGQFYAVPSDGGRHPIEWLRYPAAVVGNFLDNSGANDAFLQNLDVGSYGAVCMRPAAPPTTTTTTTTTTTFTTTSANFCCPKTEAAVRHRPNSDPLGGHWEVYTYEDGEYKSLLDEERSSRWNAILAPNEVDGDWRRWRSDRPAVLLNVDVDFAGSCQCPQHCHKNASSPAWCRREEAAKTEFNASNATSVSTGGGTGGETPSTPFLSPGTPTSTLEQLPGPPTTPSTTITTDPTYRWFVPGDASPETWPYALALRCASTPTNFAYPGQIACAASASRECLTPWHSGLPTPERLAAIDSSVLKEAEPYDVAWSCPNFVYLENGTSSELVDSCEAMNCYNGTNATEANLTLSEIQLYRPWDWGEGAISYTLPFYETANFTNW